MKKLSLSLALFSFSLGTFSQAENLTSEQKESLNARIESMQTMLDDFVSKRTAGAGTAFVAASRDGRAAIELYKKCHKEVFFVREARKDEDYRAWEDGQDNRFKNDAFVEGLMKQLQYLTLTCQAAEAESVDEVIPSLMTYVDSLSRLEEKPDGVLMQNVAGSVFVKAYYLENLVNSNQQWEPVPFNINGIYEKTILPYLRKENPGSLMNAWDKRIEQQTRLVYFFQEQQEKELRGLDRDEKIRKRDQQSRRGGVTKAYDVERFKLQTLPNLQFSKMKDKFLHVDQLTAAKEMLPFVESHLTTNPNGPRWFDEFKVLMESSAETTTTTTPAPVSEPADTGA